MKYIANLSGILLKINSWNKREYIKNTDIE